MLKELGKKIANKIMTSRVETLAGKAEEAESVEGAIDAVIDGLTMMEVHVALVIVEDVAEKLRFKLQKERA